ncbi:MAG: EamA family transporter [Acidimicrobiales bacterium]|nr:MAG: EamA family transporter [Acidimicrobiales bacterium]
MTLLPLCLILASGISHAVWNLAVKRAGAGGSAFVWLYSAVAVVIYTPSVLWLVATGRINLGFLSAGAIAISSLGQLVYYLLLQKAYSLGDLSVVYPVARGSGPLLLVGAAMLLLGERPSAVALAGAAAVVVGVLIVGARRVSGSTAATGNADAARVRLPISADVAFGLAAGVLIAACNLWDARTVSVLAVSPILLEWVFNGTRVVVLGAGVLRRRGVLAQLWREHRYNALVVGVLMPLSYILALWSFTLASISMLAPIREVSIVVACLLSWCLLSEPQPVRRLLGAAVVLTGVFALALA